MATARKVQISVARRMSVHTDDGWSAGELGYSVEYDLETGDDLERVLLDRTAWLKDQVRSQFRMTAVTEGAAQSNGAERAASAAPEPEAPDEETQRVALEEDEEVEVDG